RVARSAHPQQRARRRPPASRPPPAGPRRALGPHARDLSLGRPVDWSRAATAASSADRESGSAYGRYRVAVAVWAATEAAHLAMPALLLRPGSDPPEDRANRLREAEQPSGVPSRRRLERPAGGR